MENDIESLKQQHKAVVENIRRMQQQIQQLQVQAIKLQGIIEYLDKDDNNEQR